MKRLAVILVLALMLAMTACGNTTEPTPSTVPVETTVPVQTETAELTVSDFAYADQATLDSFWVAGTICSGADLDRMEISGTVSTAALGLSVSGDQETHYFEDGIQNCQVDSLNAAFKGYVGAMYEMYTAVAGILGVDDTLNVNLTVTVYDVSGASMPLEMQFVLGEQDEGAVAVDTISVIGLETSESGTLEQFQISGAVSSNVPLTKISGHGKATSNAVDIVVTDMSMPYYFEDGKTTADLSEVRDYILENMGSIFNIFGTVDMENHEVTIDYTFVCEDEAGNTAEFTVHYVVTGE